MSPSAPVLESALERTFHTCVRRAGGKCIKIAPINRGIPDRLVILPGGGMYLVELKTTTGALSPAQRVWRSRLAALEVQVYVIRSGKDTRDWLRERLSELSVDRTLGAQRCAFEDGRGRCGKASTDSGYCQNHDRRVKR